MNDGGVLCIVLCIRSVRRVDPGDHESHRVITVIFFGGEHHDAKLDGRKSHDG